MLLKKAYREEIFQIAIILSLFRDNYNRYEEQGNYFNSLVESGRTLIHNGQIDIIESYYDHTKAHNYTIYNFGRNYCNHLNTLGQYIYCSNYNYYIPNMITLFLNVDESSNEHAGHTTIDNNPVEDTTDEEENRQNDIAYIETAPTDIELTQEDMDLIDILWKNDVDLGIVLDMPLLKNEAQKKDLDHLLASESMLSLNTKECRNITEESNAKNGNFNINDHKDDSLSVEITDNDIKREFSNDLTHSDNVMLNNIDTETELRIHL